MSNGAKTGSVHNERDEKLPFEAIPLLILAFIHAYCADLTGSVIMAVIAGRWLREWKRS